MKTDVVTEEKRKDLTNMTNIQKHINHNFHLIVKCYMRGPANKHWKGLNFYFICQKASSPRPPTMFYISAKLNNFPKNQILNIKFFHECGQLNMVSIHACFYLFQMFVSNMHQNEWFQVWFFLNVLGFGSPSPLPRFFLGLHPWFRLS